MLGIAARSRSRGGVAFVGATASAAGLTAAWHRHSNNRSIDGSSRMEGVALPNDSPHWNPPSASNLSWLSESAMPKAEAAVRAFRLLKTVCLIGIDYQTAKAGGIDGKLGEVVEMVTGSDEVKDRRRCLEEDVVKFAAELEAAQLEYTTLSDDDKSLTLAQRDEYKNEKRGAVRSAASRLEEAEDELEVTGSRQSLVHRRAATRLLQLCTDNKGVYIKVGQHLANLDYLLPPEYTQILSALFDSAPVSSYHDVREVIKQDLGDYPEALFDDFQTVPLASASLAQVHAAVDRVTGKKLAIKVQHRGLRETSKGDTDALIFAVKTASHLFQHFTFGWLADEIAPQLPKELDFRNEGRNSETASLELLKSGLDCIVPKVIWEFPGGKSATTDRVLCMEFEEGFKSTDLDSIKKIGLKTRDVAKLISSVWGHQVFSSGFVHCDPHPANVLLREHPSKKGKPQIVLVDHGLYKQIDDNFRITYAELWRALMMADIPAIKTSCRTLGVDSMYPLLSSMLTSRPFDEILERSKTGALQSGDGRHKSGDKAMIRGYARRYVREILDMLDTVPRQMLLLFKMNDCLRHVDFALGSPTNTVVVNGEYACRAVYGHQRREWSVKDPLRWVGDWWSYVRVLCRIRLYELFYQ